MSFLSFQGHVVATALFCIACISKLEAAEPIYPIYAMEQSQPMVVVTEAAVSFLPSNELPPVSLTPSLGLGRTSMSLKQTALNEIVPPPSRTCGVAHSEEFAFDLWSLATAFGVPVGSTIGICVTVTTGAPRTVTLGVGCNDQVLVVLNGKSIFGSIGTRDYIRARNLIRANLEKGANQLEIRCSRYEKWSTVPDANKMQWLVSLDLFGSDQEAVRFSKTRNFHLLDTPILSDFEGITFENPTPGSAVNLYDYQGKWQSSGAVQLSGNVAWKTALPSTPFFGFVSDDSGDCEPLIVDDYVHLNTYIDALITKNTQHSETAPWAIRTRHLIEPTFSKRRTYWWARKVVMSLTMAQTNMTQAAQALLSKYRPSSIAFHSYISEIDGTTQYYRLFRSSVTSKGDAPLLVIAPSVESKMHEYLEGASLIDLQADEDLVDLAEARKLNILWPGVVDVDYGGNFSRRMIGECLNNAQREFGTVPVHVYLIGTCSSGVTALGYAENHKISGLILQRPMLVRTRYKWMEGLEEDDYPYPPSVLFNEQTGIGLNRLGKTPVFLDYNTQMAGHGDPYASKQLVATLKAMGGNIDQLWPKPAKGFVWGEQERAQWTPIFEWVSSVDSKNTIADREILGPSQSPWNKTVKDVLLKGFTVAPSPDDVLEAWEQRWRSRWRTFRGEAWGYTQEKRSAAHSISTRVLAPAEIQQLKDEQFAPGFPQLRDYNFSSLPKDAKLWGFRVLPESQHSDIEIFRSRNAVEDGPKIDLLVDGCCKSAIWTFEEGHWRLAEIWM